METGVPERRASRSASLLLALFAGGLILFYLATPDGVFGSKAQGDGWYGFHYLPALVLHRTLDMRTVSPKDGSHFDSGRLGREVNRNPIGPTLVMLPVYTLTLLIEVALRPLLPAIFPATPLDINLLQVFWTGLLTAAAGLLGMLVLHRLLRRYLSSWAALLGAVSAVYATPVFWYLTIQPHYQHGLAFAAVALFIERWDASRGGTGAWRFLRLGLYGGVAMLMRTQEVVFFLIPGAELIAGLSRALLTRRWSDALRWLRGGIMLLLGGALAFSPQLLCWAYYFGWFKRPATVELMRPMHPAIWETLFSTRCGLFPWSPVVYLSCIGLAIGLRRSRALVAPLLLALVTDVYLVSSSWAWYGYFGFGSRRLSDCAPIFGLGVGLLWQGLRGVDRQRLRRALDGAVLVLLILFIGLNLVLVDLGRRRVIPSSGSRARPAHEWARLARAPGWVVRLLQRGYPFVQPAGWIFALWHRAPVTAWEAVVGNYALEREAHDFSISGDVWRFDDPEVEPHVLEGLRPIDERTQRDGRPVSRHVRMLVQPFGKEPIRGVILGDLPGGETIVRWNGRRITSTFSAGTHQFSVPLSLVRPHAVAELTIELPDPPPGHVPRISHIKLYSQTAWWRRTPPEEAAPPLTPLIELGPPR